MGVVTRVREAFRVLTEASQPAPTLEPPKPAQVKRAGFEFGIPFGGATVSQQVANSQERVQILTQIHQAYQTCPWVSASVDVIARTITAGGIQVVTDDEVPDDVDPAEPPPMARLRRLLRFTNPHEDLVQLLRNVCTDLMLFGDAFIEVVYLLGEPIALYILDAVSMTVVCDVHGEVTGYQQNTDTGRQASFDLNAVIHISLDAPRGGIYGMAPAQKALLPVTAWLFAEACIKECFRRGDPESLHVDLAGYTESEAQTWREKYTVFNLGPKAIGTPIVTRNGSHVQSLNPRKVTDYLDASRQLRDEILSCFGVPPAKVGIIETGNIGGGTAEGQEKSFRTNTVIPLQTIVLEKLNYHLVQVGFGIQGWHLEFNEIDYRDSEVVEKIRDMRLRNGAYVLNRYRDEIGEPPVEGGDNAVIIDRQNMVLVRDLEAYSQAGVAQKLGGSALEPAEPKPDTPMSLEKPQPQPVPAALLPFQGQQPGQQPGQPGTQPPPGAAQSDKDRPGGPDDAAQGTPPREARHRQDQRLLDEAWQHAYRARRKKLLEQLPPVDMVEPKEDGFPVDPYWEADSHNHHDKPDYDPRVFGLTVLNRIMADPRDIQADHRYQRPENPDLIDRYSREPRQMLGQRIGLLAIRPDGSLWVVDGQHHTLGAKRVGLTQQTYQCFNSTGWEYENAVYDAYHRWHVSLHGKEWDPVHGRIVPDIPESVSRG